MARIQAAGDKAAGVLMSWTTRVKAALQQLKWDSSKVQIGQQVQIKDLHIGDNAVGADWQTMQDPEFHCLESNLMMGVEVVV